MTCPRCGHDAAHAFYRDGWMLDPVRAVVAFKGPAIPIQASWARLLVALAAENGGDVSRDELIDAAGWRSSDALSVHVHRLRAFLASHGLPDPIRPAVSAGYRWSMAQVSHADEVAHVS